MIEDTQQWWMPLPNQDYHYTQDRKDRWVSGASWHRYRNDESGI